MNFSGPFSGIELNGKTSTLAISGNTIHINGTCTDSGTGSDRNSGISAWGGSPVNVTATDSSITGQEYGIYGKGGAIINVSCPGCTQPRKVDPIHYVSYIIASYLASTCTTVSKCLKLIEPSIAHDAVKRMLERQSQHTETLKSIAEPFMSKIGGYLIIDDSTLDKFYSKQNEVVYRVWSGKHHRVVQGINLITTVWTNGSAIIPFIFRIYNPDQDEKTRNDHFKDMLTEAKNWSCNPEFVLFDTWYAGLDNLKQIRSFGWNFLTRLKSNRHVNPDKTYKRPICELEIPEEGSVVHLKGFGFVKIFRHEDPDGQYEYWVTNKIEMISTEWEDLKGKGWKIEEYHRGLKQCCSVETCQGRKKEVLVDHIFLSIQAFITFEVCRIQSGISWYEAKQGLVIDAISRFIINQILVR